jgi:phosphohistidine phosphatase
MPGLVLPELLLLRHGIAEERGPGVIDAERTLTAAGRRRTAAVLQRLVQLELGCELLCSSPLQRARQTAELAVAAGLAPAVTLAEALAPGAEALAWLQQLLRPGQELPWRRLALVGHEPDLGDLAARLLGAAPGSLQLKKAGVAVLQWQPQGAARLLLLATPRLLLAPAPAVSATAPPRRAP